MANNYVHLNGQVRPAGEAGISVFDAGFVHGASVFTTMRAHNGTVFRLDRHLGRVGDTVRLLGLQVDAAAEHLRRAVDDVLRANGLAEARVRVTLSPGNVGHDGCATTLVTAEPLPDYPPRWYEQGLTLVVSSFKQTRGDPTFGHKTGCYLPRVLAMAEAAAKHADEALWFTRDNQLAEACFCNVFLVADGAVRTAARDTPVLPGVVREAVIELCGRLGVPCEPEARLTVDDMLAAEEIFLTASCSGIRPVAHIEKHRVGDGKPGEITGKIIQAYRELLERECPPSR